MANRKISELPAAQLPIETGVIFEAVQNGQNVKVDADNMPGNSGAFLPISGEYGSIALMAADQGNQVDGRWYRTTDTNAIYEYLGTTVGDQSDYLTIIPARTEFDRAFTTTLLFDKPEIEGELHTQTDPLEFTVSDGGNTPNRWSVLGQRIVTDGVNPISFVGFSHFSGIENGEVLEAGTYQFLFWYSNGVARVSVMRTSQETSGLILLSTPTNFAAVPGAGDPEDEIDMTWTDVDNEVSYEIDFSLTGSAPWTALLPSPVANAVSKTHAGLEQNTQYFYRLRAVGDGVTFGNSPYAFANATTEDSGDATPPTFTFDPADTDTEIPVNGQMIITASEPIRDQDGVTEITNANVLDYLTAVDGSATPQAMTATIDASKTIITIDPDIVWTEEDDITITIDGVEDVNGNHAVSDNATFGTSSYTLNDGNYLNFGDILDSIYAADNADFSHEFTIKETLIVNSHILFRKWQTGQRAFICQIDATGAIKFKFYEAAGVESNASSREIVWAGALDSGEHTIKIHYKGAIDTGNGLDRVDLYIDTVLITAGKSVVVGGAHPWPFLIRNTTAPLEIGPQISQIKDFVVRSAGDTVVEINVPIIRTGEDISGNNRDGTWS